METLFDCKQQQVQQPSKANLTASQGGQNAYLYLIEHTFIVAFMRDTGGEFL